jgi:hypothetical protein
MRADEVCFDPLQTKQEITSEEIKPPIPLGVVQHVSQTSAIRLDGRKGERDSLALVECEVALGNSSSC